MDTVEIMCNHCKQIVRVSEKDLNFDPISVETIVNPMLYSYTCTNCGHTTPFHKKNFPESFFINPDP